MNVRICPGCRARVNPTALFCPECGTRVADQPASPSSPDATTHPGGAPRPPAPRSAPPTPMQPPQRSASTTPMQPPQRSASTTPMQPRPARREDATPPYPIPAPPYAGSPRAEQGAQPGGPVYAPPPAPAGARPAAGSRLPLILMALGLLIIVGVGAAYFLSRGEAPQENAARSVVGRTPTRRAQPTEQSDEAPAPEASEQPDEEPAEEPSDEPAEEEPTDEPSGEPTEEPLEEPSDEPTDEPTDEPSEEPAEEPSDEPGEARGEEPTPQRAGGSKEPIFDDDFSDRSVGRWPDEDSDIGGYHYVDDAYQIKVSVPSKILWARTNDIYQTFDVEIEATLREGPEDNTAFGLVLMENADNTLYVFQIRADGSYAFRKALEDGGWSNLVDWTENAAISRGTGQSNRLRAVANGTTIDLYINDELVDVVRDKDPYLEGTVGFGVSTFETDHALVEFDNFILREAS